MQNADAAVDRNAFQALQSHRRRSAQRRAIVALGYVVVTLLALAAGPFVIDSRAQRHRQLIADVIEPARIAAGELEAFSLDRILSDTAAPPERGVTPPPPKPGRDLSTVARSQAALDTAAVALGPPALIRVAALERAMNSDAAGFSRAAAIRTVTAADTLQQWLDDRVLQERNAATAVERWSLWLPIIMVPIVLIGVLGLAVAGREIMKLGRVAQRAAVALAQETEARAALLRGITHDLKNPLGAARGYASLLADGTLGALTEPSRNAVQRIDRLLGTGIAILHDLTELARTESGQLIVAKEPTDLSRIVADALADHAAPATAHGLQLTATSGSSANFPLVVASDPRRVREILDNLVTNAIKYTPAGGAIVISTRLDANAQRALVTVSDNGTGIPEDMRARIFDEFVRLPDHDVDSSPDAPTGTGVGLTISRRLARLLGGDLEVDDAPGGGAAFTLTLPWHPAEERRTPDRRASGG